MVRVVHFALAWIFTWLIFLVCSVCNCIVLLSTERVTQLDKVKVLERCDNLTRYFDLKFVSWIMHVCQGQRHYLTCWSWIKDVTFSVSNQCFIWHDNMLGMCIFDVVWYSCWCFIFYVKHVHFQMDILCFGICNFSGFIVLSHMSCGTHSSVCD